MKEREHAVHLQLQLEEQEAQLRARRTEGEAQLAKVAETEARLVQWHKRLEAWELDCEQRQQGVDDAEVLP